MTSDEAKPTCSSCQRLSLDCNGYGKTLSKNEYKDEKERFHEAMRRNANGEPRIKRYKPSPTPTSPLLQTHGSNNTYYQPAKASSIEDDGLQPPSDAFQPQILSGVPNSRNESANLFEINPRAAVFSLSASREDPHAYANVVARQARDELNNYVPQPQLSRIPASTTTEGQDLQRRDELLRLMKLDPGLTTAAGHTFINAGLSKPPLLGSTETTRVEAEVKFCLI